MDRSLHAVMEVVATAPRVLVTVQDARGRYVAVNRAFAERMLGAGADGAVGRTHRELFPRELADRYAEQDAFVLQSGQPLTNQLEELPRADGSTSWYLTSKARLVDDTGDPTGVMTMLVDVRGGTQHHRLVALTDAVDFARRHASHPTTVGEMARSVGLTTTALTRLCRRVLGLSPKQLMLQIRLERAITQLATTELPISEIATSCGYFDQSALTRHFNKVVGVSPAAHRRRLARWGAFADSDIHADAPGGVTDDDGGVEPSSAGNSVWRDLR